MRVKKHTSPEQPESNRRGFLKVMSLAGLGLASAPVLAGERAAAGAEPKAAGRAAMVLLGPSSRQTANAEFVGTCDAILKTQQKAGGKMTLARTAARLTNGYQVYFKSVGEANSWLRDRGYFNTLDYFVKNGGRTLVVFNELNSIHEPQYFTSRRGLAYLAFALRSRYQSGGRRHLHLLFPGPTEGLGPNTFFDYFRHYDLLREAKRPLTFGEAFPDDLDPLVKNHTMLRHGGRGVFDGVALRYDPNHPAAASGSLLSHSIPYQDWFAAKVDDSFWLYQTERVGDGKSELKEGTPEWRRYAEGRGLAPFRPAASSYHLHLVESSV